MSLLRSGAVLAFSTLVAACVSSAGSTSHAITPHPAATSYHVLFDDTKAETAGNADWVISSSMPDPTAEDPSPTSESDWTGALSSWGVTLQQSGYAPSTLPPSGSITYGDSPNPQDLSNFDAFVLPEPNVLFTAAEKTAILQFVQNGGGLFMISDHNGSDRNNDGADSVKVLNDLMGTGDPFGFSIDVSDISSDNPAVLGTSDDVLDGPFGTVTGTIIRDGTTATLHPADNSAVKGEVFKTGASATGTTGAAVVTSSYGTGHVAYWGDSSPIDDGTGQSGNTLYDGWNDPAGSDAAVALNATAWLCGGGGSTGGGGSPLANGGFENGSAPWSLSGASVTTARAHGGSSSLALGGTNSSTASAAQTIVVPSSGSLTWWTYLTTQETGTTAYDKLAVKLGATTVATLSNASAAGSWFSTAVPLTAYAGQTVALSFTATNGTKLPTTFWVDDVVAG